MRKKKAVDDLQEITKLIDKIEKSDLKDTDGFNIVVPYSSGKKPKPVRWKDKGLRHKLA